MPSTFDIETLGWDYPIAVGYYDDIGIYKDFIRRDDLDDVIWRFLQYLSTTKERVVYGHYARQTSNKFILDCLVKHGQIAQMQMGLGVLRWEEAKIEFRDSNLLLRLPLDKACNAFGIQAKLKPGKRGRPWEMDSGKLTIFRAYLERDCRSLAEAYSRFQFEIVGQFGIPETGSTLATTALKIFDHMYPLDSIDPNREYQSFIRQSLYGARNEIYCRYGEKLTLYDIRSMYLSCYDTPVPIGRLSWVHRPTLERGTLAETVVEVPKDWYIGPLPLHKSGSLLFPVGTFKGWWDMVELRYAAELGCRVKVIRQLEAEEEPVLQEFGEKLVGLRYASNPELAKLWKVLGIQLIGKLAQARPSTVIIHRTKLRDLEGWTPIDPRELYFEGDRAVNRGLQNYQDRTIKPALTMRIRAEARVRHHRALTQALETGKLFYCDTDSIYTTSQLPIGPHAGELQVVDTAIRAYFIMRKFYGYVRPSGEVKQKSSGFSGFKLTEEQFLQVLDGGELLVRNQKPTLSSSGTIFRSGGGKLEGIRYQRSIRTPSTTQNRVIDGYNTRPVYLNGSESDEENLPRWSQYRVISPAGNAVGQGNQGMST